MFNLSTLEDMLEEHEKTIQEQQKNVIHVTYKEYVSEQLEPIIEAIKDHDRILIDAPTGGGKTFAITKVMKSFEEDINIILTPNVIQNKQNASSYKIQAFTGKDRTIHSNCISATYDKARALINYLQGTHRKVNLFIDECHLLVEASNYRMRAIKDIIELTKIADKVIYMSATNDYIREVIEYDIELNIKPQEQINNISASQILLLDNKNIEGSLVHQLLGYSKIEGRKTVLFLDSIEQLKIIKNILLSKGFKDNEVAIISSKERALHDEEVFNDIISLSQIPSTTKVILSTSVLEVGTNIDTEHMNVFVYIPKANHLNINKICQEVARFRVGRGQQSDNMLKICLPNRVKEDNYIRSFTSIKKDLRKQAENNLNALVSLLDSLYKDENISIKQNLIERVLASPKSLYNVQDTYSLSVIELDEENSIPVINEFKLQRKAKEIYESQFFYNIPKLQEKLKDTLHADIWLDIVHLENESFKEEFQEVKEIKKELKEQKQDNIKEIFKQIKEYRWEYIFTIKANDPDLDTQITFIEEAYKELENTNIIKLTRQAEKMQIAPWDIVDSFIENGDSITKNRKQFVKHEYIRLNNEYPLGATIKPKDIPHKDYVYCRLIFDDVCKKQGKLSQGNKLSLLIQLIDNNILRDSKSYVIKNGTVYKNKKNGSATTLKPLDKKDIDKLTTPIITTVYKLSVCSDNKTYISSLKTK